MGAPHHSDKKIEEANKLYKKYGNYVDAAKAAGVSRETLRRRVREWRKVSDTGARDGVLDDNIIRQIQGRYTPDELRALARGGMTHDAPGEKTYSFDGQTVVFGVISDTHLGSKYTNDARLFDAFATFRDYGVDFVVHSGDVFEGLSSRDGHFYECSHIGYQAQLDHGRAVFSSFPDVPIFMVSGNHDRWFVKSAGAHIVPELCDGQDNLHFLGDDEGDLVLAAIGLDTPARLKIWHGEDGSSYAVSYRVQKIVESFTGGDKPNILVTGHTHKSFYVFDRHVHCVSAGAMQSQSKWMRSKRHASHTGFWVCKMTVNDLGIAVFSPTWFPFYE
jgi:predicted phosphodiesterase